jgi:type VI protein secretion system component VasF
MIISGIAFIVVVVVAYFGINHVLDKAEERAANHPY